MKKIVIELTEEASDNLDQLVLHQKLKEESANYSSVISSIILDARTKLRKDAHKKLLRLIKNTKNIGDGKFDRNAIYNERMQQLEKRRLG